MVSAPMRILLFTSGEEKNRISSSATSFGLVRLYLSSLKRNAFKRIPSIVLSEMISDVSFHNEMIERHEHFGRCTIPSSSLSFICDKEKGAASR